MNKPDASVIIPTYNRKESLGETLRSLAQQTWPADRFEVIVVDDGSTDGTEEIAGNTFQFTLRYFRQSNQGSAAARNTGAEQAAGNVLIFLDDDMLVEPDYVAGLIEEHRIYPRIVGMGTELPYIPPDATPLFWGGTRGEESSPAELVGAFVDFTQCVTNNLSVERDSFFEIGMMQDVAGDGPTWWGDVDFGYRADRAGFRFRRSGKAACYHRDYSTRDLRTTSTRYYHVARMAVLLFHKFPDIQPHLPMFHDKTPIAWGQDSPRLIARKIARQVASSRPVLKGMEQFVRVAEQCCPSPTLLRPLYRWIVGGYIFRGYREGLREYGPVGEHRWTQAYG
jgi:glycosyltransferase involved in cell wall biosynthesis